MHRWDVVVVGAGLAGAAAARSLAARGRTVLVVEQFAAGHAHGSSHGSARIVRRAYGDGLYVGLTGRAFELWRETEQASGTSLLRLLGGLDFGPGRDVRTVAALLAEHRVPHELLPAAEAEARWPGMRFEGEVVHHPQAGTVDADAAVTALLDLARRDGAQVRHDTAATALGADGGVRLSDGSAVRAGHVVATAGAWVERLVAPLVALPPLEVTEQHVLHLPRRETSAPAWPSVIHESGAGAVYHLAGGRDGGPGEARKIGRHDGGAVCTADGRSGVVPDAARDRLLDYAREWLPGLVPEAASSTTCLYTATPSEDLLLDRVGPLVVCSPCSGHGAKFAPLVGELVADLVDGRPGLPERFTLPAHRSGRRDAVSL